MVFGIIPAQSIESPGLSGAATFFVDAHGDGILESLMLNRPSRQPRTGKLAVRILGSLIVIAGLAAVMAFTIPEGTVPTLTPDGTGSGDDVARRCEEQLADLMEALSPGRLGISSDRAQVIDRMNIWRTECGGQVGDARPSSDIMLLETLLHDQQRARTLSERFLAEDATHIRMSLLARDIATSVVGGQTSNVNRAVALFDFVCRNVMLINDDIRKQTVLTPYESLVFGMGTAEDRAWIFAELLRQLRIDTVILTPRSKDMAEHWLVGVIEPQAGILLFDPRLGLPIPAAGSPEDTLYPNIPATLRSVREAETAFHQLDIPDSPYPLTSAAMQDLDIFLIGSSSGWAPRMALLQFLLPPGVSVDLYDGLGANELRSPGAFQRIVDAGKTAGWSEDRVQIWPYAEEALVKFESTRGEGEEKSQLAGLQVIFRGPYIPRPVGGNGKTFQPTPIDKSLHFVRIEQLRGKYHNAIRDYLPIRTTVKLVSSPANESAAEFGTLWTGVSQFQTQKIRAALGTFDRYVTMQARSVGMSRVAIEFMADCLLTQKNYEAATTVLEKAPPGFAPRRDTYLIRRWKKMGGIDPDKPTPSADKPESEKKPEGKTSDSPKEEAKKPGTPKEDAKKPDSASAQPAAGSAGKETPSASPSEKSSEEMNKNTSDDATRPSASPKTPRTSKPASPEKESQKQEESAKEAAQSS